MAFVASFGRSGRGNRGNAKVEEAAKYKNKYLIPNSQRNIHLNNKNSGGPDALNGAFDAIPSSRGRG